jgi:pantetheine-phosphate adenylyltransferase
MAGINKDISNGEINTVCLFADNNYQNISSSMVKEVFTLGKPISRYVSPVVEEAMREKYVVTETETGPILSLKRKEK